MVNTHYTNSNYTTHYLPASSSNNNSNVITNDCAIDGSSLEKQAQNQMVQERLSLQLNNAMPSLFSAEERHNIEIGCAVLQERIKLKQALIDQLQDENISQGKKIALSYEDHGTLSYLELKGVNIPKEIEGYCFFITKILDVYKAAEAQLNLFIGSKSLAEKNKFQNDLYYFLSFEAKHFREWVPQWVPEHSLEDNFYEMIYEKLCGTATKKHDKLNEYLKLSKTPFGIETQVDNEKLYDQHWQIYTNLKEKFGKNCPLFWLCSLENKNIKKLADDKYNKVNIAFEGCRDDLLEIRRSFDDKIKLFEEDTSCDFNRIIHIYDYFGKAVLGTIKKYEMVFKKIQKIEEDAIQWLTNLNKKNLTADQKFQINQYLDEQKKPREAIELEKAREAKKTLTLLHEQNRLKNEQKRAKEPNKTPRIIEKKKIEYQEKSFIPPPLEKLIIIEETPTAEPKVKVKTRPQVTNGPIITISEAIQEPTLPDHLTTPEFKFLIEDIRNEKNEAKLKKLFSELNSFGVFAENVEKNNKGYFCVKSPITGTLHVRTYHHLHNTENHYASLFMAVREVLVAADLT